MQPTTGKINTIACFSEKLAGGECGVITLITIMGVGLLAFGAVLTVALGTISGLHKNQNTISGDQVFYTGESGVSEGAYQYLSATTYKSGVPVMVNDAATGTIIVTPLTWPYVKVRGTASNIKNHRAVVRVISVFPEGQAFDYAVYAKNDLTFSGNAEINGNIYAQTDITFNSNASKVNGNAYASGNIDEFDANSVTGVSATAVAPISPPTLDPQPYEDAASASGTYFATSTDAVAWLKNNTRAGVIFVDATGTTDMQGTNTVLNGSLVTMGDLILKGGTFTATGSYAAVVVLGDLELKGGVTINGIVYVSGSTTFGVGNNTINGSLISAGGASTDISGNATINFNPLAAANWTSLTGLVQSTTSTPIILNWGEE